MKGRSCSQAQTSEDNNYVDTVVELNNEPETKFSVPICREEFVKKLIGKKWRDYKCDLKVLYVTKYKTKDALMKNRPSHIPRDQWNPLVSYWLSEKAKKRSQANKISRAKQTMAHTGGSKSIATLMNEQDMMKEKMSNDETQEEQSNGSVAGKGDVYSQVLENEKSGYVRGLGPGPTPSLLWIICAMRLHIS